MNLFPLAVMMRVCRCSKDTPKYYPAKYSKFDTVLAPGRFDLGAGFPLDADKALFGGEQSAFRPSPGPELSYDSQCLLEVEAYVPMDLRDAFGGKI